MHYVNILRRKQLGVTATEYALILALVAVLIIGAAFLLGSNVNSLFGAAASEL